MTDRYAVALERDVIGAAGPEAAPFLQGQLSQDLLNLGDRGSTWSWVLAPNGKVDGLVRVTRLSDQSWMLDIDGGWGDSLVTRLNRFKLRTKVEIDRLDHRVLGLRGEGWSPDGGAVAVEPWPGVAGWDVIGPAEVVGGYAGGIETVSASSHEAERIVAGTPRMGAELTEKTIPAETGLNDMTVSFTKGCYTGQELVARIDARGGHVPRHLRGLRLEGAAEPGAVLVPVDGGETLGTVTSVAHSADRGWVGLAYVKRGVEVPGRARVGEGGPIALVEALVR